MLADGSYKKENRERENTLVIACPPSSNLLTIIEQWNIIIVVLLSTTDFAYFYLLYKVAFSAESHITCITEVHRQTRNHFRSYCSALA